MVTIPICDQHGRIMEGVPRKTPQTWLDHMFPIPSLATRHADSALRRACAAALSRSCDPATRAHSLKATIAIHRRFATPSATARAESRLEALKTRPFLAGALPRQ